LGKALSYGLNEWVPLNRYLEEGRLEIDNNSTHAARGMTPVGGRKSVAGKNAVVGACAVL